eukprot:TRINITY_DN10778_c0_g1_i1.p1 TRINITY_DN10778_c0_g1~~TRINITY_DN10778_c0_g1_i1.p1  ORF type:complete len:182 (-),score=3.74 TRINITY_DN10778_c0_g1_i1:143-688(-)
MSKADYCMIFHVLSIHYFSVYLLRDPINSLNMIDGTNRPAAKSQRVYPEELLQASKSSSTSCSTLPILKTSPKSAKLSQKRIRNLGIVRSGTTGLQENSPELEVLQLKLMSERNNVRRDRNGQVIDKNTRKHKITFRDYVIGRKVADITEVVSYKKYNYTSKRDDNCSSDEEVEECHCLIL